MAKEGGGTVGTDMQKIKNHKGEFPCSPLAHQILVGPTPIRPIVDGI